MNPLETNCFVTLLGGGDASETDLSQALNMAPRLIAADSGADFAFSVGHSPEMVIGDLDSISAEALGQFSADQVHRVKEQETTDFEKCLREIEAELILAVGFTGKRLDHQLAVFNALVKYPHHRCIVLGDEDVVFHCPRMLRLRLPMGTRLSLFPMTTLAGRSTGLRWALDGLQMAPDGQIGTSNQTTADDVLISSNEPGLLVILPREHLPVAIAALLAAG